MIQSTSTEGTQGLKARRVEDVDGLPSSPWDSVGQATTSERGLEESMDIVVRRLVAEKHPEHFGHFVLEIKVARVGLAPGIEVETYPNLHVYRHHVWVTCPCGADLLLE